MCSTGYHTIQYSKPTSYRLCIKVQMILLDSHSGKQMLVQDLHKNLQYST